MLQSSFHHVFVFLIFLIFSNIEAQGYPEGIHDVREEEGDVFILNLINEYNIPITKDLASQVEFEVPSSEEYKEYFRLDHKTGDIFTRPEGIDREEICPKEDLCELELKVGLYKPPSLFNTFNLKFAILDNNDHSPVFRPDWVDLNISEDAPLGTFLDLPQASDEDYGNLDVQSYEITRFEAIPSSQGIPPSSDGNVFEIVHKKDSITSFEELNLKLVRPLDYEQVTAYKLTVQAYDGEQKFGSLKVVVNVTDVNDNVPLFEKSLYTVSLEESYPVGQTFLHLKATDVDSGLNGKIKYFFPKTQSRTLKYFKLDPQTGELSLAKPLNHKQQHLFDFQVVAQDSAARAKLSLTTVQVTVIDINNFAPEITIMPLNEQGNVELFENEPSFTFVFQIFVHDSDSDLYGKVTCFINNEEAHRFFRLDKLSEEEYKVVTSDQASIDKEVTDTFLVNITCRDHGEPPQASHKTATIQIRDVDDNAPYFEQKEYSVKINENNAPNLALARVVATDADKGLNSSFRYSLCHPKKDSKFVKVAKRSGVVYASTSFDFERVKGLEVCIRADNECRNCSLQERNRKAHLSTSTTTKLFLEIVDLNDNKPLFEQDFYDFEVDENSSSDVIVGSVKATDADSYLYNEFEYNLFKTKKSFPFKVDMVSGVLSTNGRSIDRETKDTYIFNIYSIDLQNKSLYSETEVTVRVLDLNDNPPQFHSNCSDIELQLQLDELTTEPLYVCSLKVSDKDDKNNSVVVVQTMKLFEVNLFVANGSSNSLFLMPGALLNLPESILANSNVINFNVTTNASDFGDPPLFSSFKHSVKLDLGSNFTIDALREVLAKKPHPYTKPVLIGVLVLVCIMVILFVIVIVMKVKSKKKGSKLATRDVHEAPYYESLKRSSHNNNKNSLPRANAKNKNIFTNNNGNLDNNPEKTFMIQTNINNNLNNNNNNNNNNKNTADANNGKKNDTNKTNNNHKSSSNFWDKHFRKRSNQSKVNCYLYLNLFCFNLFPCLCAGYVYHHSIGM